MFYTIILDDTYRDVRCDVVFGLMEKNALKIFSFNATRGQKLRTIHTAADACTWGLLTPSAS